MKKTFSCILILSCIVLGLFRFEIVNFRLDKPIISDKISHDSGYAYTVYVKPPLFYDRDSFSSAVILENNHPLGPVDNLHDHIRQVGLGKFSYWNHYFYFSTSDNSDPRVNQREYVIHYPWIPEAWVFYGLLVLTFIFNIKAAHDVWKRLGEYFRSGNFIKFKRIFSGVLILSAFALGLFKFGVVTVWLDEPIISDKISHDSGHAYTVYAKLPFFYDYSSLSSAVILENNHPLGPVDNLHDHIRQAGLGKFSYWNHYFYFSTSDNTDPRENQREYAIHYPWIPEAWVFYGLLVLTFIFNIKLFKPIFSGLNRMDNMHPAIPCFALMLLALGYRLFVFDKFGEESFYSSVNGMPFSDASAWYIMARDFARGLNLDFYWSGWSARRPFYYIFMGSIFSLTGASVLINQSIHILLSTLSVGLVFDMFRRVSNTFVALITSILLALNVYDSRMNLETLTETLGHFLTVLSLWFLIYGLEQFRQKTIAQNAGLKKPAVLLLVSGLLLALSNLARPLNLPAGISMVLVSLLWIKKTRLSRLKRGMIILTGVYFFGISAALAPWIARQYTVHGILSVSDNSSEMLYAATSPKYGSWVSEVGELPPKGLSIKERSEFYSNEIKKNLRDNPTYYLSNVAKTFQTIIQQLRSSEVIFLFLLAVFLSISFLNKQKISHYRSKVLGTFAVALIVCYFPNPLMIGIWLLGCIMALWKQEDSLILVFFLLFSILSISLTGWASERLYYSLGWLMDGITAWSIWMMLNLIFCGNRELRLTRKEFSTTRSSWGKTGRAVLVIAAGCFLLFSAGLIKSVSSGYASGSDYNRKPLSRTEADKWISYVYSGENLTEYLPIKASLKVYTGEITPGLLLHVKANEKSEHWSPLFASRPYSYTVFRIYPEGHWCIFPGRLPHEIQGEKLVFVGAAYNTIHAIVAIIRCDANGKVIDTFFPAPEAKVPHSHEMLSYLMPKDSISFDFGKMKYPIVYNGDTITASGSITKIDLFKPIFGPDRSCVNPIQPVVQNGSQIKFSEPGEYYLYVNNNQNALKALVLSRNEPLRESVLRLFDFCVANMLVCTGHEGLFAKDRQSLIDQWFRSDWPLMLICGPTQDLFGELVEERFGLPWRAVTFPGTFMQNGKVGYVTHNVPEVYLPDLDKWVLFDLNHGFMVKWLGAFEVCDKVREAVDNKKAREEDNLSRMATWGDLTKNEWEATNWDMHNDVPESYRSTNVGITDPNFHKSFISEGKMKDSHHELARLFVGGAAYWGGLKAGDSVVLPNEEYQVYYASLHDPFLAEAAARWDWNWNLNVKICKVEELKGILEKGYQNFLNSKPWMEHLPKEQQRLLLEKR
ncbi:MAG: hypothetical protein R6X10_06845 [Desulfobacterales bacterium]